jgi:prokaryotic ubiquitin-like protein Pup
VSGTERIVRPGGDRDEGEQGTAGQLHAPSELLGDVDGLLDEIDAVLEENAEAFVRGYVQKGGQ